MLFLFTKDLALFNHPLIQLAVQFPSPCGLGETVVGGQVHPCLSEASWLVENRARKQATRDNLTWGVRNREQRRGKRGEIMNNLFGQCPDEWTYNSLDLGHLLDATS